MTMKEQMVVMQARDLPRLLMTRNEDCFPVMVKQAHDTNITLCTVCSPLKSLIFLLAPSVCVTGSRSNRWLPRSRHAQLIKSISLFDETCLLGWTI